MSGIRHVSRDVPPISLALLLLPAEARPFACAALTLVESWLIGWWHTRVGPGRLPSPRAGLIGTIVLALAILPVLAYASPPDPSWLPGLYDNGDYDDVVMLVTSATGDVGPDIPDVRPVLLTLRHSSNDPVDAQYNRPVSVVHGRAPPAA